MGLLPYLLRSIIQLTFVAMDVLLLMVLIKVAYDRWHFTLLEPLSSIVEQPLKHVTDFIGRRLSRRTRKSYPEKTRIILLVLCMTVVRLVICALV